MTETRSPSKRPYWRQIRQEIYTGTPKKNKKQLCNITRASIDDQAVPLGMAGTAEEALF